MICPDIYQCKQLYCSLNRRNLDYIHNNRQPRLYPCYRFHCHSCVNSVSVESAGHTRCLENSHHSDIDHFERTHFGIFLKHGLDRNCHSIHYDNYKQLFDRRQRSNSAKCPSWTLVKIMLLEGSKLEVRLHLGRPPFRYGPWSPNQVIFR